MNKIIIYIFFVFLTFSTLYAQDLVRWGVPIMPLKEVKPGMEGTGKTVFYGTAIEDFRFKVLDIIENQYPHFDVILVQLVGEKVEKNGVVSGMSGSPVYIDGKLVGALSMRFGEFMLDPIGGVTPIEQMLRIEEKENNRELEVVNSASLLPRYINTALCGAEDHFWESLIQGSEQNSGGNAAALQAIKSPLVFSGFDPKIIAPFQNAFEKSGFTATVGGSKSNTTTPDLEPGSAVSQVFINGDFGIESTGTVTAIYKNRLLAFGHYMYNLGPVNLPLAKASILATLPSMMGSSKMAAATDIVGVFRQDRLTGALGDLSIQPVMTPVDVEFKTLGDDTQKFHFNLTLDKPVNNLMPLYLRIALIQAFTASRLAGSMNSMRLNSSILLDDGRVVQVDDFFSSRQQFGYFEAGADANEASDLIASALGAILVNDFVSPSVKGITVNATEIKGENIAKIYSIWQDKTEAAPGDTINFTIDLKTTRDELIKIHKSFYIPVNLDAPSLTVLIASASTLTTYEVQLNRAKFIPNNFDGLLKILKDRRLNNNLYFQVQIKDKGFMLEGEELSALPPSIMNVMGSMKSNGYSQKLQTSVLYEDAVPTDYVIIGAKKLVVRVRQPQQATIPDGENAPAQPTFWQF